MSRIGKKLIPLPAGVKYKVEGNTVVVEGPKGKVSALIAPGITLETKDGVLHVNRENDSQAAMHGLTRALVANAVQGVTTAGSASSISSALAIAPSSRARELWCSRLAIRIPSRSLYPRASMWQSIPSRPI